MSNLSDIGFDIGSEEEFYKLAEKAYEKASPIEASTGTYFCYSDPSGAELWIQMNEKKELIGANPHFKGSSKRKVCLTAELDGKLSELDGAFHSWANPLDPENPESGEYPFVFDVPDYKTIGRVKLPQNVEIQLSAFAQELDYYDDEQDFSSKQGGEFKWAAQSFVPSGLFNPNSKKAKKRPEALGIFSGIIKNVAKKKNELSGNEFLWLLVDTLGGEIDVVADLRFINKVPEVGGIVHGQFWLSGRLITKPSLRSIDEKKSVLNKIFRRR